jgi:hypothetical protein
VTVFEIRPGYAVTDAVFEQVRELLATEFPGVLPGLTWHQFTAPAGGAFLIPDPTGAVSKLELILTDSPAHVVKVNQWFLPDLRAGQRPAPHNHRWRTMRSRILSGGYRDHAYWSETNTVADQLRTHETGSDNVIDHHEFHEVTEVEPGSTWTCFVGDRSQPGDWGYLDPDTGRYTHNAAISPDPNFTAVFNALNP